MCGNSLVGRDDSVSGVVDEEGGDGITADHDKVFSKSIVFQ